MHADPPRPPLAAGAEAPHAPRPLADDERARLLAAEDDLRASEARFRSLFESIDEGFCIVEVLFDEAGRPFDYRWIETNPAFERQTGLANAVGRTALELVPELEHDWVEAYGAVATTGEPRRFQLGSDAMGRWFDVYAFRVEPAEDRRVALLFTDISAKREAEREHERLLAEAELARSEAVAARRRAEAARLEADEANQAKSGFLATMSHELRTPLNAIIGYAQLLDLGMVGPLTLEQRGYLERLTGSAQHLLGLVDDVLDLSRIEAGETHVARQAQMSGPAVRAAVDLVHPLAASKGVRLVGARPDDDGVPYVGDEDRVRQILLNLLGNAVKFTARGGTVTVTCERVEAPLRPTEDAPGSGPWTVVRVRDTGVGIDAGELARIFDPFHQVHSGRTRTQGGTGLGLAISRRLARLMGGDLTVESVLGEGSLFSLWLPIPARPGEMPSPAGTSDQDARLPSPAFAELGLCLREAIDGVVARWTERMRKDPAIPRARTMPRAELEDHQLVLLHDLAQSLLASADPGSGGLGPLRDGTAIQRTIAERHGARRWAQGWNDDALLRELAILREEIERSLAGIRNDGTPEIEDAARVLFGLLDRTDGVSLQALRQTTSRAQVRNA